jgi:hypothetical protein
LRRLTRDSPTTEQEIPIPALVVLAVAVLAGPSAATADSTFTTNLCQLVPAKQVSSIVGVSSKCTNAASTKGPGSTIYSANWGGKASTDPRVQVTISVYTNAGVLQLAKHNLKQGLPGPPKAVSGIGSAADVATGAASTGIHLNVGKYIAYINVSPPGKPSTSIASVEALAKAVAARL